MGYAYQLKNLEIDDNILLFAYSLGESKQIMNFENSQLFEVFFPEEVVKQQVEIVLFLDVDIRKFLFFQS